MTYNKYRKDRGFKTSPIYCHTVSMDQETSMAQLDFSLRISHSRCWPAMVSSSSGKDSDSKLIHVTGRIQFLASIRLRSHFLCWQPTWGQSQFIEVAASSFSMAFSLTQGFHNLATTECFKANSRISPCQIFMLWVSPFRKSPFHFSAHLIQSTPLKIISFLKASNHQSDIPSFSREGSYIRM